MYRHVPGDLALGLIDVPTVGDTAPAYPFG
jgi:hypothetical protein